MADMSIIPSGSLPSPPKVDVIPTPKQVKIENLKVIKNKNNIKDQLNVVKYIFKK